MQRTRLPLLIACTLALGGIGSSQNVPEVAQWTRFEAQFRSSTEYLNPVQEAHLEVEFTSPTGTRHTARGFWDGETTWKVRFSPEQIGRWTWVTRAVPASDSGLNGKRGEFICVPYTGDNPLYRHGSVRVSEDRRYLVQADGTPFFWLGDTAWNVPHLSDPDSWQVYLNDRIGKGFTAIQFVATQFKGFAANAEGRQAFSGRERIAIDPWFFQRLDSRVDVMNSSGLLGVPVLAWANEDKMTPALNPGYYLPDDQIMVLASYIVARYGAHQVAWILAGDADYRGERSERWKKIGRAVFGHAPSRPVTMHPGGRMWVAGEFRNEPWFRFTGYQSGHRGADEAIRWHTQGPPASDWKTEPHHPTINLEPIYEAHIVMDSSDRHRITAREVRNAIYWSLLVSPTAGVTYGSMGIWDWEPRPQVPPNHPREGLSPPWREALQHPGAKQMKHVKSLFSSLQWWRLRPAQELLADQPGMRDPHRFVAVAAPEDHTFAVAYLPAGGPVTLITDKLKSASMARWFNPRTGEWSAKTSVGTGTFTAPDQEDWVLWIGR